MIVDQPPPTPITKIALLVPHGFPVVHWFTTIFVNQESYLKVEAQAAGRRDDVRQREIRITNKNPQPLCKSLSIRILRYHHTDLKPLKADELHFFALVFVWANPTRRLKDYINNDKWEVQRKIRMICENLEPACGTSHIHW